MTKCYAWIPLRKGLYLKQDNNTKQYFIYEDDIRLWIEALQQALIDKRLQNG